MQYKIISVEKDTFWISYYVICIIALFLQKCK